MFKNLNHALRWTFEVLERDITGYSNTAAIMRLGEQCGASASTSPDDLTIQEQKAQAVWVSVLIFACTSIPERHVIYAKYGSSLDGHADFLSRHICIGRFDLQIAKDIICNIYNHHDSKYKMKRIADRHEKHIQSIYRLKDSIEKQLNEWQFSAEKKIEDLLIEKGLINRLT